VRRLDAVQLRPQAGLQVRAESVVTHGWSEGNAGAASSEKSVASFARRRSAAWLSRVPIVRSETPRAAAISRLL
jgi:hypothetical protein